MSILKTKSMDLGLSRLAMPSPLGNGEYIGTVLSESDDKGRVKAMISPLFDGLSTDALPWISMASDVRFLAKPKEGDKIGIEFRGSVYEGFYTRVFVNDVKVDVVGNLGDGFIIDLDQVQIFGKYNGSELDLVTPEFTIEIRNGESTLKGKGVVNIDSQMMVLNQGTAPMLNQMTPCQYSGSPHVSTMPNVVGG